jgi:CarD family transcriptional regulator
MYQPGELILYGRTGVCRVEEITRVKPRGEEEHMYYVLKPLYHQSCNITIPVGSTKVFSRPIISKEEAQKVIAAIPTVHPEVYHNRNLNQLREYYRSCMETYDCADLIKLTMSLYVKKKEAEAQKRKFGAVDERFMKEAEELLFGELAAALEIPKEEVRGHIEKTLA